MVEITNKLKHGTFIAKVQDGGSIRHVLVNEESLKNALQKLSTKKESLVSRLEAKEKDLKSLLSAIKESNLEEEDASTDLFRELSVGKVSFDGLVVTDVPISDLLAKKDASTAMKHQFRAQSSPTKASKAPGKKTKKKTVKKTKKK